MEKPYISQTLYKRDLYGHPIQWSVEVEVLSSIQVRLKYKYGRYESNLLTESYSDFIQPKNTGRSNATTIYDQAVKEAKSTYTRQLKKGYKTIESLLEGFNLTESQFKFICKVVTEKAKNGYSYLNFYLPEYNTDADNVCKPMKCQKFQLGKMHYPALVQPKINGVRCIIMWDEVKVGEGMFATIRSQAIIKSKEGLRYEIKHIEDAFYEFYSKHKEYKNIVFDGELYIKDKPVTTIGGAARNRNNEFHKNLKFVCFDLAIPDMSNDDRENVRGTLANLSELKHVSFSSEFISSHVYFNQTIKHIIFLNSLIVDSDEEVLNFRDKCIEAGYEGCVVRDMDAEYKFGQRPMTMMKCKTFDDSEFEVIDIKCRGNAYDKVGFTIIYLLKNDINDLQFECNGMGTVEEKIDIYNHKDDYISKYVTVKFYERTKNGLPFHANVVGLRDYES